jgi:hypothetical protein
MAAFKSSSSSSEISWYMGGGLNESAEGKVLDRWIGARAGRFKPKEEPDGIGPATLNDFARFVASRAAEAGELEEIGSKLN